MPKIFVAPGQRPDSLSERVVQALPSLLAFIGVVFLVALFYPEVRDLLSRTTKFKAIGIELEAAERKLGRSDAKAQKLPETGVKLRLSTDDPLRASLVRRWAEMDMSDRRLKILLLHDRPEVARALRSPFAELGFSVDIGICSVEARSLLQRHSYDVVISDINWKKCPPDDLRFGKDGKEFLRNAYTDGLAQPTVFYIENFDRSLGTPAYAAGISNNWYEVLHFVLDVVSRQDRQ